MCVFGFLFQTTFVTSRSNREILIDLIRRTKEAVKEFDNIRYRRMRKVLMGHHEQSATGSFNVNQSSEILTLDNDNSISIQNEIIVRTRWRGEVMIIIEFAFLGRSDFG